MSIEKALIPVVLAALAAMCLASQPREDDPLSRWRPGRDATGVRYVGSDACARCHAKQASTYLATPMAHAAAAPAESDVLAGHSRLTFRNGPYTYEVARQGDRSTFTVGDGTSTISEPILYCFGRGVAGQTFVFRHDGALYEGRVSYFKNLQGLDVTILHPRSVPKSLEDAVGRRMSSDEAQGCFACHNTPEAGAIGFRLDSLVTGVGCEACHGPGEQHVAAVKQKTTGDLRIFNPAKLDAIDLTQEFCGACHLGFDRVMTMPDQAGLENIRFQPYRLFKSASHFGDDARLGCVACHDPHDEVQHEPAFYDSKCLACHLSSADEAKTEARAAAACPVGARRCVTCHMPKVELPEMHASFTDHWIRIAKPNDPVPR
jgi:hypothetical protein